MYMHISKNNKILILEFVSDIRGEDNFAIVHNWGPSYAIQFDVKIESLSSEYQEIISFRPLENTPIKIPQVSIRYDYT